MSSTKALFLVAASALVIFTIVAAESQSSRASNQLQAEKAVLARLADIQSAAQALNPDKVFSYVLENDKGALVQNGKLFLTRQEALESTRQGFQGLSKVDYRFDRQHITFLSPTVALAVGDGVSTADLQDGRSFTRRFAQSVLLVLTNGEWKVFHSHRSFPPNQ
jgi:hypothetical protein